MQLSAANLLLAAQAARQAPQPKPAAFAAALASEAGKDELFAPLDFKQAPAAKPQQAAQGPLPRPGATLDIRV